jgi:hypothetical protein
MKPAATASRQQVRFRTIIAASPPGRAASNQETGEVGANDSASPDLFRCRVGVPRNCIAAPSVISRRCYFVTLPFSERNALTCGGCPSTEN